MNWVILIFIIPLGLFLALLFSGLFGSAFRRWNEGEYYDQKKSGGEFKTLITGLIILVVFVYILLKVF